MPPAARLWLARASLYTDTKGRTAYGPTRCATDLGLDPDIIAAGINWLTARGLVAHDHDEQGRECWRLMHYDWDQAAPTIGGYGPDRGLKRDGLPPMYGRPVDQVITPPTGNLDYTPPTWDEIAPVVQHGQETA
jgi:hypothetical protein